MTPADKTGGRSKEQFAGKPVISATGVSILRSGDGVLPDALVAGKQIFATPYTNGALSPTAILRGDAASHNTNDASFGL